MIEAFGAYIKTITAFLIFSVFVEMLLPDGNTKKYVAMVLGLVMVAVVLSPAIALFNSQSALEIESFMPKLKKNDVIDEESLQKILEEKAESSMEINIQPVEGFNKAGNELLDTPEGENTNGQ